MFDSELVTFNETNMAFTFTVEDRYNSPVVVKLGAPNLVMNVNTVLFTSRFVMKSTATGDHCTPASYGC